MTKNSNTPGFIAARAFKSRAFFVLALTLIHSQARAELAQLDRGLGWFNQLGSSSVATTIASIILMGVALGMWFRRLNFGFGCVLFIGLMLFVARNSIAPLLVALFS